MNRRKDIIYYQIATLFGAGNVKFAPGTLGSVIGLIFACFIHGKWLAYSLIFGISFIFGLISSDHVQKQMGIEDPNQIIIDEFACIFAIFFFVPNEFMTMPLIITAFTLYRIFDIFKIPPVNLFEKLKGGFGIMLDDLACAVITGLILHFLISFKIFVK